MKTWFYVEKTNGVITFHASKVSKSVGWINRMIVTRADERKEHEVRAKGKAVQILPKEYQYNKFYYTESAMDDGSIVISYAYRSGDYIPSEEWRAPEDNITKVSPYKF